MKKIRDAIMKFLRKLVCLIMWVIGILMFIAQILFYSDYDKDSYTKGLLLFWGAFIMMIIGGLIGANDFSFKEEFKKISKRCKELCLVVYIKTIQIICYIFCLFKSLFKSKSKHTNKFAKEFIKGFKEGFKKSLKIHSPSKEMFTMSKKYTSKTIKTINKRDRSQIYSSRFFVNIEDSDGNSYIISKNLLDCAGTYIDVVKGNNRSDLKH